MKMGSTLVVIDMQDAFQAAHNTFTMRNIIREIKRARKGRCGIVMVCYENCGRLLNRMSEAIRNYPNVDVVWKNSNDGGTEVYNSIINNYFNSDYIKICGVNTDACVYETVRSLSYDFPCSIIEVIEDACNSEYYNGNDFSWMDDLENVQSVESNERQGNFEFAKS